MYKVFIFSNDILVHTLPYIEKICDESSESEGTDEIEVIANIVDSFEEKENDEQRPELEFKTILSSIPGDASARQL